MSGLRFFQPRTLDEASSILHETPAAVLLGGGQHLVPRWRFSPPPPVVVSLQRIDALHGVRVDARSLSLGAQTTLRELSTSAHVQRELPALAAMASRIGDRFLQNRATVGGALCATNGPGCLPAALLGSHGIVHTTDRRIPAVDWFDADEPASRLRAGELIVRVTIPLPLAAAHMSLRPTPARFALVTIFATRGFRGFGVGVSGLASRSFRSEAAEAWLAGGNLGDREALSRIFAATGSKPHGGPSPDYLRAQARRLLRLCGEALEVSPPAAP